MKRFKDYWEVTPELPEAGFKIYLLSKGLDAAEDMLNDLAEAIESLQLENEIRKAEIAQLKGFELTEKQVDSMTKTCPHHKPGEVWGGTCSCCDLCPFRSAFDSLTEKKV